ncbi:MAG: GNAT family N-acyltransferase [Thermodesulfobacteriota bacterium]
MEGIKFNNISGSNNFLTGFIKHFYQVLRPPVEQLTGLNKINELYASLMGLDNGKQFIDELLSTLGINIRMMNADKSPIPSDGGVIVVANHPFGGLEGIVLASILAEVRQDVKIMANYVLRVFEPIQELFFFVDPFGKDGSITNNIKPLKEAKQWVDQGKMLVIFPAGTVSHLQWGRKGITDPPWSTIVARLLRKTAASVLPVFFNGANGYLFQILGLIHPLLRTALLPRELLNKQGKTVTLKIGQAIPWERMRLFTNDRDLTDYLRVKTYGLRDSGRPPQRAAAFFQGKGRLRAAPIIAPLDARSLSQEVEALPRSQLLLESGEYAVFSARARQVPQLLQEIGRLREITFRQAEEGTGKSIDLDRFDPYYLHLFLWNRTRAEVVGAYRLGQSDEIVKHQGITGLYTSTLFTYNLDFLRFISPALELGRSFVRREYQKNYSSLLLLWKGIGAWLVQNPQYRNLFGPVSINNQYHTISQNLIATSLRLPENSSALSKLVKPKNGLHLEIARGGDSWPPSARVRDIDRLADLIADIENDSRGIPILLKQYLKLGGQVLAFSRDPKFNNVLDGLILVDMALAPRHLLARFLGQAGMASFLAYHQQPQVCEGAGS